MFISSKALWFSVTDCPLVCLVAARVINGTLLATRETCFRSDTDTEQCCVQCNANASIAVHTSVSAETPCVLHCQNDGFRWVSGSADWMRWRVDDEEKGSQDERMMACRTQGGYMTAG